MIPKEYKGLISLQDPKMHIPLGIHLAELPEERVQEYPRNPRSRQLLEMPP